MPGLCDGVTGLYEGVGLQLQAQIGTSTFINNLSPAAPTAFLLLEDGISYLLLEDSSKIGLESSNTVSLGDVVVISYGQSNSLARAPLVTNETYLNAYTVSGGRQLSDFAGASNLTSTPPPWSYFSGQAHLAESAGTESYGSGLAYQLLQKCSRFGFFAPGFGGMSAGQLQAGTVFWTNLVAALTSFRIGYPNAKLCLLWDQGEADEDTVADDGLTTEVPATASDRLAVITKFQADVNRAASYVFGSAQSVPFFIIPKLTPVYGAGSRAMQAGDLLVSQNLSGAYYLPPWYTPSHWDDTDFIHMLGNGKRPYSELIGAVIVQVLSGTAWLPLYCTYATRSGTTLSLVFNKPIAIDTTTFPEATGWANQSVGVEFYNASSAAINLSSPSVSGSTLTLTLASNPGAGGNFVRIAQQPAVTVGSITTRFPRSNIREVSPIAFTETSTPLYSFSVPQEITGVV